MFLIVPRQSLPPPHFEVPLVTADPNDGEVAGVHHHHHHLVVPVLHHPPTPRPETVDRPGLHILSSDDKPVRLGWAGTDWVISLPDDEGILRFLRDERSVRNQQTVQKNLNVNLLSAEVPLPVVEPHS